MIDKHIFLYFTLRGDVKLSRTTHFEIGIDDQGRNFTIYNLESSKISLIGYGDLKDFKWKIEILSV